MPSPEPARARHLLHVFSTFGVGGPQVRFAAIANHFGRAYRHTIIAMDGDFSCADRLDPGLDVELMPMAVRKGAGLSLANLRSFRATLKQLRPDLLVTYNWGAVEWALANRILPICRNLHLEDGFGPEETGGRQLLRRVWTRRIALSGRSDIVLPSQTLEQIARQRWRFSPKRLHYVPNGVDCARFASAPGGSEAPVVGSVGTLRAEKNFGRLIRAVAPLSGVQLVLVGDGAERAALERTAAELGVADRVHFAGRVDRPERLLGRFDLYALSSDTEQMPISLVEAMAAGLPVAATDVGDVMEMVAPDNRRFVTPAGDDAALTGSIAALLQDAGLRRSLGEANRARACAEYGEARMFAAYAALFDR